MRMRTVAPRIGRLLSPALIVAVILTILLRAAPAAAQGVTRVALVIDPGDGTLITTVVTLSRAHPTGYDVLQQSGVDVLAQNSAMGVAICSISGTGCPMSNCFCQAPANNWTYWHLQEGIWVYSAVGASMHRVSDGAVEGWRWGSGDPPRVLTFDEVLLRESASGGVSAQQAYPGPETPIVPGPTDTYDPYPGPGQTQTPPVRPSPGPVEPTAIPAPSLAPSPGPSGQALTPTITLRPTYTPATVGTASPGAGTPAATLAVAGTPADGTGSTSQATATAELTPPVTATADRVAILISTAVAQDKEAARSGTESGQPQQRSYGGFVALALLLMLSVCYLYLLRRQRRAGLPRTR
jgi:hypothetical protein